MHVVYSKENCPNLTFLDVSGTNIRRLQIEKLQVCSQTKDGAKANTTATANIILETFFVFLLMHEFNLLG